jgi:hypothetical protein
MPQEPKLTYFPRPYPALRTLLEEWGFTILEPESDQSEVVKVILPEGWQKKRTYLYDFDLFDDQGNKRGDGQCSDCLGYFRVDPKYIPEPPSKPNLYEQCLSFFKKRSPDA